MSAKLVFVAGVLGVGGYFGFQMSSFDPAVFPYSKDQVQSMLTEARTTLPRRDGPGQIQIWSTGRTEKGVGLQMQYASWAPVLDCQAVITAIAPDKSRVVADCGSTSASGSAIARTQDELRAPMFDEHIQATLGKRAFNRATVDQKQAGAVFKNLPGMQHEALRSADEAQRMQAESRR
jgi:hypothetical protein